MMSLINTSTFPSLQKLVIVINDFGDGRGWLPKEITYVSPTKPSHVVLLEPTDQLVKEFDGRLREFEITLPLDMAVDLESKLGNVQVINGGEGFARFWEFWRPLPERLQTHKGLSVSEEIGYWIFRGERNLLFNLPMSNP